MGGGVVGPDRTYASCLTDAVHGPNRTFVAAARATRRSQRVAAVKRSASRLRFAPDHVSFAICQQRTNSNPVQLTRIAARKRRVSAARNSPKATSR
jgi:hypothetical protein